MRENSTLRLRRLILMALFAALMIASKEAFAALPNIEPVSLFIIVITAVYRHYALLPIYVFVAMEALLYPFPPTTVMYLYVWLVLFALAMLLPRDRVLPAWAYALISGGFGLLFGVLCAPTQALMYGLDFSGTLAWIAAGFPFDVTHAVGNAVMATLAPTLIRLLRRLEGARQAK